MTYKGCSFTRTDTTAACDSKLLSEADLSEADLSGADLSGANIQPDPYCPACAAHYGNDGICDLGMPKASPHRKRTK